LLRPRFYISRQWRRQISAKSKSAKLSENNLKVTYENITKFVQQAVTVTDCGLEISIIGLCCVVFYWIGNHKPEFVRL